MKAPPLLLLIIAEAGNSFDIVALFYSLQRNLRSIRYPVAALVVGHVAIAIVIAILIDELSSRNVPAKWTESFLILEIVSKPGDTSVSRVSRPWCTQVRRRTRRIEGDAFSIVFKRRTMPRNHTCARCCPEKRLDDTR